MVASGKFNGLSNSVAADQITDALIQINKGERVVSYRLNDWLISRQRYWGTPIPVMYDENDLPHLVPDDHLPVELPTDVTFDGKGNPMASSPSFKTIEIDGKTYRRETDTMDTFFDSSWYFLRYCDAQNQSAPYSSDIVNELLPVDIYIGGIEHACMHLLYARFFSKAFKSMGWHQISEPFQQLICQGMVLNNGVKMSKSLGNTVDPTAIINEYGADTARLFILFGAPVEKDLDWSDDGVQGSFRFLKRLFNAAVNPAPVDKNKESEIIKMCHKTIVSVTTDIESFQFNTAISRLMELVNVITKHGGTSFTSSVMARLIAPFAPFIAESIWQKINLSGSVHNQSWPVHDPALVVDDEVTFVVQVNGKVRAKMALPKGCPKDEVIAKATNDDKIKEYLNQSELIKTIVVPDRIVNFVVKN